MKSCRFSFAVHVMAVLAVEEGECCSSSRLAQTVNTNPVVIRRLLLELHHAGLVRTRRGPQGGAVLSRRPDRINLLQIQAAVDPQELFGLHPNPPSSECPVGRRIGDVMGYIQRRATRSYTQELRRITLQDVVQRLAGP
ncbi:MAG: Rrf2 family transcriptional regulator [Chthoniobacterales bacterium]|jgi:Rrf2 family protein